MFSRRTATVLLLSAAVLCAFPGASAWGPVTHYHFTCSALQPHTAPAECVASSPSLILGADMPDAFFFSSFISGSACPAGIAALHDGAFAGFMLQQAVAAGDGELAQLAAGFGSHVAADVAGFFPGGFLGTGGLAPGMENWVTVWPFMQAVDGLVMQQLRLNASQLVRQPISDAAAAFVANATAAYAAAGGGGNVAFPVLTATDVSACVNTWSDVLSQSFALSEVYAQNEAVLAAVLPHFDQFADKSLDAVKAQLAMAASCASAGIVTWVDALDQKHLTPAAAYAATLKYYEGAFKAGKCAPQTS